MTPPHSLWTPRVDPGHHMRGGRAEKDVASREEGGDGGVDAIAPVKRGAAQRRNAGAWHR
jgi:hypothetical protein